MVEKPSFMRRIKRTASSEIISAAMGPSSDGCSPERIIRPAQGFQRPEAASTRSNLRFQPNLLAVGERQRLVQTGHLILFAAIPFVRDSRFNAHGVRAGQFR